MDEKQWTRADIFTSEEGLEPLGAALLELGVNGFEITGKSNLEEFLSRRTGYWDYYDESLLKMKDSETAVTLYLPDNGQGHETLAALRRELGRLKSLDSENEWGRLELSLSGVREEDWANGWKKYYHPVKIGERLVVCPSWEEYGKKPGEVIVKLDPGMAFGTGTHESTRLCLKLMEKNLAGKPLRILDLGCGSGILAVSAALLGAESALGLDIDEASVRVANENAALNEVSDKCRFIHGELGDEIDGRFDIILANLIADLIIGHAGFMEDKLDDGGVLIASGIIDAREDEAAAALTGSGLDITERAYDGGWVALAYRKKQARA